MSAIRILIIDDSVVVRRFVSDILMAESDLEVSAVASNGRLGLARITQNTPDLVILDLEMPEMDGLETLDEIRKHWSALPVIMYSSLTHRGAIATLEALERGANDYVTKPARMDSPAAAAERVRQDLIPKIRALVPRIDTSGIFRRSLPEKPKLSAPSRQTPRPWPVDIVAFGTSTGGPNALTKVISSVPADFPVPILIVQHMPPLFTAMLADRLAFKSEIEVKEAAHGDRLTPGRAWIAPGDHHMVVVRSRGQHYIELHQGPHENSCRPSVDVLFKSIATAYGPASLAIVMTGMGNDGLKGSEKIHEAGGSIFAQDEASSVVWGMPGYVARAGLAERVLPLDDIGPAVVGRVRQMQLTGGVA